MLFIEAEWGRAEAKEAMRLLVVGGGGSLGGWPRKGKPPLLQTCGWIPATEQANPAVMSEIAVP